jgi:AraC-like DNA-binding protein
MNKIPIHKIHELSATGMILERFQGDIAQYENLLPAVEEVHRDNYYIFFLQECGEACLLIDFKECRTQGVMLGCILPGQVHIGAELNNISGWFLCIDALFVDGEWKEIFEKAVMRGNFIVPDDQALNDLRYGFELLHRKMQSGNWSLAQHSATLLMGVIAELYQHRQLALSNKRAATIARQFKALLPDNLNIKKSPSQYAALLNISTPYLNESVKNATGFTVGYWIRYEVILEAKRLLFHTDMSIKEISFKLGYEDYSYFTRLFTKIAGASPLQFRKNYCE